MAHAVTRRAASSSASHGRGEDGQACKDFEAPRGCPGIAAAALREHHLRHEQLEPVAPVPPLARQLLVRGLYDVPAREGGQVAHHGCLYVDLGPHELTLPWPGAAEEARFGGWRLGGGPGFRGTRLARFQANGQTRLVGSEVP